MKQLNSYIIFEGNCKQAFDFYKSVFETDFLDVNTFKDMPPNEHFPITEEQKKMIMHISIKVGENTLMGSDNLGLKTPFTAGNNYYISINITDLDEAKEIYAKLSEEGTVEMPLEKTFWNAYYAMFKDKFGVGWMINCSV